MLQIMAKNTPTMIGTTRFRSTNHLCPSSHCGHHSSGSSIIRKTTLPPPNLQYVTRTLIIRSCKNHDQFQEIVGRDHLLQESVLPKLRLSVAPLVKFATSSSFLPSALIAGVVFALINPSAGCLAHKYQVSKFSIIGIFLISGLTLPSEEIGKAAEAWPVGLFGLTSILLLTPLLSKFMMQVHLKPQEFVTGLALYNCMPTAISSGVALTRLAGGNSTLALAMTVLSSLLGILIIPFSVSRLIAGGVGATVPADEMFRSLIVTVLIPLILGKLFRESIKGMADIVDSNRKHLSVLSAILLGLIPWVQVSKSRPLLLMVKPEVALVAVLMGALLHLMLLCFNALLIQILCAVLGGRKSIFAKEDNYKTVLLVASQKTMSVLVAVVEQLGGTFGEAGLLVLPCIAAHIIQVIIDSFIVGFWNKRKQSLDNVKIV
ncbi:putative sodium/metabolite cotransporter BASS4, chloroplastic [Bidens hawaiensis]|uniref:putative sodium/metabolite cotransporter BASS4, chloroplastic n=1 Tax=Bidens hawaiensis TaxID=980011 RepID=UPI00404A1F40